MVQKIYQHIPHKHVPRNVNQAHKDEQAAGGFNTRLAVRITRLFGSIQAFYVLVAWMLIWIVLASAGFWVFALDRYPFSFLLFLSNLVQLWALPVLAVGTSVLGRKAELQAEEQYKTTQATFHDAEQMAQHLDAQDEELLLHKGMLVQIHQTLLLVLDHLGIEAMETTDHKLPVARIQGHRTSIDEDGLFISLSRAGIKPELLAALSLETRLAIEKQRPHGQHEETHHGDL